MSEYVTEIIGSATINRVNSPIPQPPFVPTVSKRQAKRALLDAGLLDAVESAIAAMPAQQRRQAKIEYEDATEWRRDWPLITTLAQSIGLTDSQIDALFVAASAIK